VPFVGFDEKKFEDIKTPLKPKKWALLRKERKGITQFSVIFQLYGDWGADHLGPIFTKIG